ncbi:hypothetical protein ACS5LO_000431 [Citrobacter koseri]
MSVKPRNFDKNVEHQLLKQGVYTQEILSNYSDKEKKFFFNQLYIGSVGEEHTLMIHLHFQCIHMKEENISRQPLDLIN